MAKQLWIQKKVCLTPRARGFHLITSEVVEQLPELHMIHIGLAHFFLQHTSASLAVNENADESVRVDMEASFNQLAPENASHYTHVFEGPDDMPAHIKTVLTGVDITLPISGGRLELGLWQGLYLCEHRIQSGSRKLLVTLNGEGDSNGKK